MTRQWAVENSCKLNEKKTEIMLIRKSKRNYPEGEI